MTRSLILALAATASLLAAGTGPAGAADEAGQAVFQRNCAICHSTEPGKNRLGPSLAGVVGRKAGTAPGYNYSTANKDSGVTWDEKTLDQYLESPQRFMPGTKMAFIGLKNPDDRKAVIAYLAQQK